MILNENERLVPAVGRFVLGAAILTFLAGQGRVLLGTAGILSKYTFLQGFTAFGGLMLADPLTTAGLIDLIVMQITFAVVIANGLPRGPAYPWLLAAFLIVDLVYPGLAGLGFLFFHWRRLGQFRP
jgi:hypothetical protein